MNQSVFIVAAERSGDDLGAGLIKQLRQLEPDVDIKGIGGSAMAKAGVSSDYDISPLAILGFTEAIRSYPMIRRKVSEAVEIILMARPNAVVLIDSWGFMLRVAWALRQAGYQGTLIKYVAPQVWAMREGRSKVLARAVDHLLTIHSFDAPYFERHGLPVHYVGNPVFDTDYRSGDREGLKEGLGIKPDQPILALLMGSRRAEIERLSEPLSQAVEILRQRYPHLAIVSPVSESVIDLVNAAKDEHMGLKQVHFVPEHRKLDVFAAANVALACSGTVTTQLACAGVPTVVTYKVSAVTFLIGRMLYQKPYVSIVNIAADKALMPECLQGEATPESLAREISVFLDDRDLRTRASEQLLVQTNKMRGEGGLASERAARAILSILNA